MSTTQRNKGLNVTLWIAQVILAAMFLMAGLMKSTTPIEELYAGLPWTQEVAPWLVRFIGVSEFLAGLGLLLPSILRIKPILTPFAAIGLVIIMILAVIYHIMYAEYSAIGINVTIGAIAGFVAWGRFKKVPITAK